jgi:hypothetical protein
VNARKRFGVFMPKMSPKGCGFESPSGQKTIFPIKYTRNVESMQNTVKSTVIVIERPMTIYIDSTSQTRGLHYRSLSEAFSKCKPL